MKKIFTVLVIALFTISISAQETKTAKKAPVKKEANAKKCTAKEKENCKTEEKEKNAKTSKSCCAKKV